MVSKMTDARRIFASFDGMAWPLPNPKLSWRLRYAPVRREDLLLSASIVDAYGELLAKKPKERESLVRKIR